MALYETVRLPTSPTVPRPTGAVLLVEDDVSLLRALSRILSTEGYRVVQATTTAAAVEQFRAGSFDAVVSDIHVPGANGLELLDTMRTYDPDVSLVVMTGDPSVETAIEAVHLGVVDYLVKPMSRETLVAVLQRAVEVRKAAVLRRETTPTAPPPPESGMLAVTVPPVVAIDRARMNELFDRALLGAFSELQPIVDAKHRTVIGYEAKLASREETAATHAALVAAAEKLGRVDELCRRARDLAVRASVGAPSLATLFVDLHATDLLDTDLYAPESPLARIAERVVLQIRARGAALDLPDLAARVSVLRFLGYRLSIADVDGARPPVAQLAELAPDFVGIDAELVRDVAGSPSRRRIVGAVTAAAKAIGATTLAEGVTTAEDRDALVALGCDLVQGPLLSRLTPGRRTPMPAGER